VFQVEYKTRTGLHRCGPKETIEEAENFVKFIKSLGRACTFVRIIEGSESFDSDIESPDSLKLKPGKIEWFKPI
jgi:hypothetical protein